MLGAGAAGVGHVDMRVGAIGDQCIRMLDHLRTDVGVQIETGHQRHVLADQLAHAREDLALSIVEMLCHHRPVQIEIDAVNRAGRRDTVEQHRNDALEGVFGDVRRRRGPQAMVGASSQPLASAASTKPASPRLIPRMTLRRPAPCVQQPPRTNAA